MNDPVTSRRLYPPHWFAILLLLELVLNRWLPVVQWIPPAVRAAGWALGVSGFVIGGWAALLFKRAKTGIVPFSASTSLVTAGPYLFTRNPMYLGMALMLLGAAILTGALTPFVAPVAFVFIVIHGFILPEEKHMERTFGASYVELKRRVRRWL
jgi:protein-S-isoprenylcysteine O-methyltransferase Ste14